MVWECLEKQMPGLGARWGQPGSLFTWLVMERNRGSFSRATGSRFSRCKARLDVTCWWGLFSYFLFFFFEKKTNIGILFYFDFTNFYFFKNYLLFLIFFLVAKWFAGLSNSVWQNVSSRLWSGRSTNHLHARSTQHWTRSRSFRWHCIARG